MLLLIVKYRHGYVTAHLGCIARHNDQNQYIHAPYHILKMNANGASTIVGCVSWVIWGCDRSNIVINKVLAAIIASKEDETICTPS
jgi:hypothetical protein